MTQLNRTDLVIQGLDIETADLKALAKLSGASGIEQLAPTAFRLHAGRPADGPFRMLACGRLPAAPDPRRKRHDRNRHRTP